MTERNPTKDPWCTDTLCCNGILVREGKSCVYIDINGTLSSSRYEGSSLLGNEISRLSELFSKKVAEYHRSGEEKVMHAL